MDQVKRILGLVQKHHFWVLCGAVIVVGAAIWTSASADLADRYQKRKTSLEGTRKGVLQVTTVPDHPNEGVVELTDKETAKLRENVYAAWEKLYDEQATKNPWPDLGPEFNEMIATLGPEDEIPGRFREDYMYYIKEHFPKVYDIIKLRQPKKIEGREGMGPAGVPMEPGMGMAMGLEGDARRPDSEMTGVVEWNDTDRQRFERRFYWSVVPTSREVRLAQEDLWVYMVLLRAIAGVNEGAASYSQAPIKRIEALEIGEVASLSLAKSAGRVFKSAGPGMMGTGMMEGPGMTGPGMTGPGMMGPGMTGPAMPGQGMEGSVAPGGAPAMGPTGPAAGPAGMPPTGPTGMPPTGPAGMPSEAMEGMGPTLGTMQSYGRYVDKDGNPLPASVAQPFAEFKMMPVRMLLYMDQAKVDDLMVLCTNSSMPIKITRVSLRPGQGQQIDLGRLMPRAGAVTGPGTAPGAQGVPPTGPGGPAMIPEAMGGFTPPPGGFEGMAMEGMEMGMGMEGPPGRRQESQVSDMPVEIEGIIDIFNPPDRTKLGTGGTVEQGQPQAAAAQPITPAPGTEPPAAEPAVPPAGQPPEGQPPAGQAPGIQPPIPAAGPPATPPGGPAMAPAAVPPTTPPAAPPATPAAAPPAAAPPGPAPAAPAAVAPAGSP